VGSANHSFSEKLGSQQESAEVTPLTAPVDRKQVYNLTKTSTITTTKLKKRMLPTDLYRYISVISYQSLHLNHYMYPPLQYK
jgi:hypothetical protein